MKNVVYKMTLKKQLNNVYKTTLKQQLNNEKRFVAW